MPESYDILNPSDDVALQMQRHLKVLGLTAKHPTLLLARLAAIQQTTNVEVRRPMAMVFGSSHGVILPHFPEIALEADALLTNFLQKDAPLFQMAPPGMQLRVVDAGLGPAYRNFLNFWLHMEELMELPGHWDASADFTTRRAMSSRECKKAMKEGARLADKHYQRGSNLFVLGTLGQMCVPASFVLTAAIHEQGISEVLPESDWHRFFPQMTIDPERAWRKLGLPLKNNPKTRDPLTLLSLYGAPDLAMLCGAMLKAASLHMAVVLDGLGALVAASLARRLHPALPGYLFSATPPASRAAELLTSEIDLPAILPADYQISDFTQSVWAARHLLELATIFGHKQ
jgi:nicotinate-nucleotide--dimethylbenzimidazole phosphoribosyltransferase